MVRRILQPFYTAYVFITFVVTVLAAFPFIALIAIGNNARVRKAIHTIIYYWSKVWLGVIGMRVTVMGTKVENPRHVVVLNHISYLDTIAIFPAIRGYFRPLGKKEMSKIPVVGFIYRQIVIMVDRSSQQSRAKSMRLMWRSLKHEGDIVIFPEGTFNETGETLKTFYDGAFRLAINTQTPILPVVFPDTVHRWHYSGWWKLWPGKNRAVFLPEVPVAGMGLDQLPQLKASVYTAMETELRKYNYP
jgi:1-acyl-sn-glycerol-3-phosphate acyltransferase